MRGLDNGQLAGPTVSPTMTIVETVSGTQRSAPPNLTTSAVTIQAASLA
jgi:hypothetical protein